MAVDGLKVYFVVTTRGDAPRPAVSVSTTIVVEPRDIAVPNRLCAAGLLLDGVEQIDDGGNHGVRRVERHLVSAGREGWARAKTRVTTPPQLWPTST